MEVRLSNLGSSNGILGKKEQVLSDITLGPCDFVEVGNTRIRLLAVA